VSWLSRQSPKGKTLSAFYWLPVNKNVRNFNKHAAAALIRFADKGISRADLAEKMGLTCAVVTVIIVWLPSSALWCRRSMSVFL